MRLLIVSHSLVHPRQIFFCKELAKHIEVVAVGPRRWRSLLMNDCQEDNFRYIGLPCKNEGDNFEYTLPGFDSVVEETKPDTIYAQCEPRSVMAREAFLEAKKNNLEFIVFTWENLTSETDPVTNKLLDESDLIVCGNSDAYNLLRSERREEKMRILPQVGIDLNLFKPDKKAEKDTMVLYVGRKVTEKGIDVIAECCNQMGISYRFIHDLAYQDLPAQYNRAKIFVSLPVETPFWKEQAGSYTNLEAMACGIPVITTDCGAIPEYLSDAVLFVPQKNGKIDTYIFQQHLENLLHSTQLYYEMREAGLKQVLKYSNEEIAKKFLAALNVAV